MRIVSWTVILGAAVALWFGGIRPLLPEGLLPEVDPATVSGTAVRKPAEHVCGDPADPTTGEADAAGAKPDGCNEKLVTQH